MHLCVREETGERGGNRDQQNDNGISNEFIKMNKPESCVCVCLCVCVCGGMGVWLGRCG